MASNKKQKGAKFPADLAAQVDAFAAERDISQSDAIRRLVRDGIRYQEVNERLQEVEKEHKEVNERLETIEHNCFKGLWSRIFS